MQKSENNMLKISTIFSKTHDFKTHLNPSNRVQNRFGVVEKIAIECFDPNPENQKKIIKSIFLQLKFSCQVALFKGFQKVEKSDFCLYLSKKRTYEQMDRCKKKLWSTGMWILT